MRGYLAAVAMTAILLLPGCDGDSPPPAAKAPATPVSPVAKAPPVASESSTSAAELRALRLDPLPARALVLPEPPPRKKDLAKNTQLKKPAPAKEAPVIQRPLDLSVPGDLDKPQALTSHRAAGHAGQTVAESGLLPQLFRSEDDPGRFQLGGRVISRDRSDDFEGAEVELRFRR
ncbi:hypothetical protein [Pseudomonas sp. EpS/L25]|uniref:hypothetical protein n=1 Tax=Pseudomonas sp. EpS/L25 TaxID=1749078 RepID=UPI001F46B6B0|nr:hypothetical protein [Pseudomonas sp. EpS/L25]